jgi:hypothetical protein
MTKQPESKIMAGRKSPQAKLQDAQEGIWFQDFFLAVFSTPS